MADRLRVVFGEQLECQHTVLGIKSLHAAIDHFLNDVRRLARGSRFLRQPCSLGSDLVGRQFFGMSHRWLQSGHMHGNVLQDSGTLCLACRAEEDSRLPVVMRITTNRSFDANDTSQNHFLTNLANDLLQQPAQRNTRAIGSCCGVVCQEE